MQKNYIKTCRDRRPRLSKVVTVKNELPYAIKQKIFISSVGATCVSPVCSGFSQKPLKPVILSEQRVASRTFGFVSGNIANKSKSENCQDNFRDLLRFILSFWLKSNILCRVGIKYNLFVDPSVRGQATPSPFLTTPSKKVRLRVGFCFCALVYYNISTLRSG